MTPITAAALRSFVSGLLPRDPHARGGAYTITSLYLDTVDLTLYRQTMSGEKNRFKLRVRTYSDDPAAPAFLEVKQRVDAAVLKNRARLDRPRAVQLLSGSSGWSDGLGPEVLKAASGFTTLASLSHVEPFVHVRYAREAYEAADGEPLRMTFDTELEHAPARDVDFTVEPARWRRTPVGGVVFEVKFTDRYPSWVADMIRMFGLQRQSVPKYVLSMDRVLAGVRPIHALAARDLAFGDRV